MRFTTTRPDLLGFIPDFILEMDPRPAREQINDRYAHGGGWHPFGKGEWVYDPASGSIKYPGDPAYLPVAKGQLRDETILVYKHAWVCIVQKDGSFEVSRMD
jgi:hypothetical protein